MKTVIATVALTAAATTSFATDASGFWAGMIVETVGAQYTLDEMNSMSLTGQIEAIQGVIDGVENDYYQMSMQAVLDQYSVGNDISNGGRLGAAHWMLDTTYDNH